MRDDLDLNFLAKITSEQLDPLVQILTQDKKGKARFSESLTSNSLYQDNQPDHHQYWHIIADEIQRYGANTIATAVRGKGVLYREITSDVAKKLKVDVNKSDSITEIELSILTKILTESLTDLSTDELKKISDELDLELTSFTSQDLSTAIGSAVKNSKVIAYQVALIVSSAVTKQMIGRGLKLAANIGITRTLGFILGPIGWTASAAWTAADVAGPAYRVTIPAVVQVAMLRAQQEHNKHSA